MKRVKRPTERRLVDVLVSFLGAAGRARREVPLYERRIDIAVVVPDTGEVWAIEAKSEDWQRALEQAVINLAAAQRSYIAVYSGFAHRVSLSQLSAHGIGLLAVGTKWGDVSVLHEAAESPFANLLAVGRVRERVLGEVE